jgi:hypothetical protein
MEIGFFLYLLKTLHYDVLLEPVQKKALPRRDSNPLSTIPYLRINVETFHSVPGYNPDKI